MSDKVTKAKYIQVKVNLNDENLPVNMTWDATDKPAGSSSETKAVLISLFDKESRDTLRMDLWTSEFQIIEMDRLMYQTLRGLADSYFRGTGNRQMAEEMRRFAEYFGKKADIIPKQQ